MTEINVPLLRKVLEFADAHPEETALHTWARRNSCGTTACIAGRAVLFTGHEIDWNREVASSVFYTIDGQLIEDVAMKELGVTDSQANDLFYCPNVDAAWEAAERLTNGEIRRNP